jgi:hypothetical protein
VSGGFTGGNTNIKCQIFKINLYNKSSEEMENICGSIDKYISMSRVERREGWDGNFHQYLDLYLFACIYYLSSEFVIMNLRVKFQWIML